MTRLAQLDRRHVVAVALVAALAVVAVPVAVLAARDDAPAHEPRSSRPAPTQTPPQSSTQTPPPAPAADAAWLTAIPADVRIDGPRRGSVSHRLCGDELFPADGMLDGRAVAATGPEYAEARDLRLFPDDRAAHLFVVHVMQTVDACPAEEVDGGLRRHRLERSALGADEAVAVQVVAVDGDAESAAGRWEVVRAGNAVLVAGTGRTRERARGVRPVVEAMCVFSGAGCAADIPAGFPLLTGFPADGAAEPGPGYGRHGPGRDLAPLRLTACGRGLPDTPHTDRLLARWTNVEDFRTRRLTTYATTAQAAAGAGALAAWFRSCPSEGEPDGQSRTTGVAAAALGDQAWTVVRRQLYDGAPAVGLEVVLVIRVGRGVLVDVVSDESGAGPDPDAEIRQAVAEQATAAAEVVAAMQVFTDARR
jgi:hypothetical protein